MKKDAINPEKEDEKDEEEVEEVEEDEDEEEEDEEEEDEEEEKEEEEKRMSDLASKFAKMVEDKLAVNQKKIDTKKAKLYASPKKTELTGDAKALEFLKAVISGDRAKIQPLSEGVAANGGVLVPEEWYNQIVERKLDIAVIEPRCTVLQMTTDTLHLPYLTARPHIRWRSELGVKSTTTANWNELTLTPYSKAAIITVSEELVMDASIGEASNVIGYLSRLLGEALVDEDERVYAVGSGSGQPTGMFGGGYAIPAVNALGAINAGSIVQAYHRLPMQYRQNACWIMSSYALELVRGLRDTTGQLIVAFQNINGTPSNILMGRPILECNKFGDDDIYFGDFSYYYIGRRQGITIKTTDEATVANYSAFERDLVHIKAEERVDGELVFADAFYRIQNIH